MKSIAGLCILIFSVTMNIGAQALVTDTLLREGLGYIRTGEYERAGASFRATLNDPDLEPFHPDALYWLVKTDIQTGRYGEASRAAYRYMVMYPDGEYAVEMEYQSARILFLEDEPEKAIVSLSSFIDEYPDSSFVSSAYYWIGESLMALGRLEEADAVFAEILSEYPSSAKREASRYRRSEISLLYREKELLDLLKWSHEEYLQDTEEFYRREAEYRDAVTAYGLKSGEEEEGDRARLRRERLLDAKARLLDLRKYYVDRLLGLADER